MSAMYESITAEDFKAYKPIDDSAIRSETAKKMFAASAKDAKEADAAAAANPLSRTLQERKAKTERKANEAAELVKSSQKDLTDSIVRLSRKTGISSTQIIEKLKSFHDANDSQRVYKMLMDAQTCDLCFVYDATGSMSPAFDCLKSNIRAILSDIKSLNANLKCRLGLVVYRDPEDGDGHFEVLPFDTSVTKFERRVTDISCRGGGDECEDVIGALRIASEMDWTYKNRILFLCGDAPCHGRTYHKGCNDNHPEGLGVPSQPILHRLIEQDVQMIFWKINSSTDTMIAKFNEEASSSSQAPINRSRDEYISTSTLEKDPKRMVESMKEGIRDSIKASMSFSASGVGKRDIKHSLKKSARDLSAISEGDEDVSATPPPSTRRPAEVSSREVSARRYGAGGGSSVAGGGGSVAGGESIGSGKIADSISTEGGRF